MHFAPCFLLSIDLYNLLFFDKQLIIIIKSVKAPLSTSEDFYNLLMKGIEYGALEIGLTGHHTIIYINDHILSCLVRC